MDLGWPAFHRQEVWRCGMCKCSPHLYQTLVLLLAHDQNMAHFTFSFFPSKGRSTYKRGLLFLLCLYFFFWSHFTFTVPDWKASANANLCCWNSRSICFVFKELFWIHLGLVLRTMEDDDAHHMSLHLKWFFGWTIPLRCYCNSSLMGLMVVQICSHLPLWNRSALDCIECALVVYFKSLKNIFIKTILEDNIVLTR